ncbi:hypothetical protein [Paramicrobacterium chengjingii]|uniref:DUF2569 domain-containing protein n=1 Tax=Paramicrobacterium chengjingii TaxID=2769067 RepID=A0ABX6YKW9_9MICO|nr:hypothetical protein [Microbacterium chengjingii]QPZ39433.1 hypothetical protein HCR76_05065 [Microbacterium chengjingii]
MMDYTPTKSSANGEAGRTTHRPRWAEIPIPLKWLIPAVGVGIFLLIALPVAMVIGRDGFLRDSVIANDPQLDPRYLEFALTASIIYAVVLHAIDVVLSIWFVVKIMQGRQWARIALSAYLVIATFGSLYSAAAGSAYLWAVIPGDSIHVIMLVLLWAPRSVRDFFARYKARGMRTAMQDSP